MHLSASQCISMHLSALQCISEPLKRFPMRVRTIETELRQAIELTNANYLMTLDSTYTTGVIQETAGAKAAVATSPWR
jgi:hypothetical protein